jgi:ribosomal protein S18 acetylase RimI-like enzyme
MALPSLARTTAIRGMEENICDYVRLYRVLDHIDFYDGAEVLRMRAPHVPNAFFNSILHARLTDSIEARIDAILAPYMEQLLPIMWWEDTLTQPATLGKYLKQRSFHLEQLPGMMVELDKLPATHATPSNFRIAPVRDAAMLRTWIKINANPYDFLDYVNEAFFHGYGRHGFAPELPLQNYIGYLDDVPVACSTMLLASGVAGIYSVATLPMARQHGIGSAMTLYPLLEARQHGYQIGVLTASPEGFNLYYRMGFRTVTQTKMWVYY